MWKTITKSYNSYAKYPENIQKLSGIFYEGIVMSFSYLVIIPIGISGDCLYTLRFLRPVRNV